MQEDPCLRLSSEFTFRLGEGLQRAVNRLAELRGRSIGSLELADPLDANFERFSRMTIET